MLSTDELEQLTREERAAWAAANETERLFLVTAMKRLAYQRAIEKVISLDGRSAAVLQAELTKLSASQSDPPPPTLTRAGVYAPSSSYGVARGVIGLMDWVAVALIAGGFIVLLMTLLAGIEATTREGLIDVFFPPFGMIVTGIVIFVQGQMLGANLDTADATREILAHARLAAKND